MTKLSKKDILDYIKNNLYDDNLICKQTLSKEIIELFDIVSVNKNKNQILSEKYLIDSIIDEYYEKVNQFNIKKTKLDKLMKLKLPEQRSPEWYEMRRDKLTASSIATAVGDDNYKTKYNLIHDKLTNAPHVSNIHTTWGTKYEEIATLFYQLITGTTIKEFGLVPHPDFPIFGASPDGICDHTGPMEYCARMLEIKCPTRREFWKTGNKSKHMPHHYWMQMQGQMEVCDLDECDFLQVKLEEYDDFNDYKNDVLILGDPHDHSFPNIENYDTTITGKTSENLPKGCTITYLKEGQEEYSYLYPKLLLSDDQSLEWIDGYIKQGYNIIETKWWKITRYHNQLILRDKPWWNNNIEKIISFYNDYIYFQNNMDELEKEVNKNPKKEINIMGKSSLPKYMLCD